MTSLAAYNEVDPFAAVWLRELICAGLIAPGEVLECSIEDLTPNDIRPFAQFHAFAGIGVWSYALRLAGWPDDRPVWTGSCPCQPFSAAGKGGGFADERHLWPAFHHLIRECRPPVVFGEQVASKDGLAWFDLVQSDLEATGYAAGAVDFCAAGVGAPHIRQRLWWVGERLGSGVGLAGAYEPRLEGRFGAAERSGERAAGPRGVAGRLEHATSDGRDERRAEPSGRGAAGRCGSGGVADAVRSGAGNGPGSGVGAETASHGEDRRVPRKRLRIGLESPSDDPRRPGPTNGFWRDADWLFCRDELWRPVGPGTFPLAHGSPARVGRLRGYGNAIVAQAAAAFIGAYLDVANSKNLTAIAEAAE